MPIAVSGSNIVFADGSSIASGFTGFKNRIINGAMVIDQRNNGASVTPTGGQYALDRWTFQISAASKLTAQQNAGSVTPPAGFTNYLGIVSSSAYSVAAGDYFSVRQIIEGYNIADLAWGSANAKTVTLSFWVRSSLTGTFGGVFTNSNYSRSYPFTYTISSANTWEQKSVTVTGDTSGTWQTTTSAGINVEFGLGVGSTYSGAAGAWAGAAYDSATGATSVVGTNGATFYITGVQLEVGSTATSFEYRDYGNELNLCLRYYHFIGGDTAYQSVNNVVWYTSGDAVGAFRHPVPMRTTPTIAKSGSWATLGGGGSVGQTVSADQNGPKTTQLGFSSGSGGSSGQASVLRVSDDLNFRLTFSAEL
jgi:hypothetical protein